MLHFPLASYLYYDNVDTILREEEALLLPYLWHPNPAASLI
jgi:hypothetical protein